MTQVATKTASSNTTQTAAIRPASAASAVSAVLRDTAFVLMMTKKVKDAMLGKGTEPSESANTPARRRTAAGLIAA